MTTQVSAIADALRRLARGSDEAAWEALVCGLGADVFRTCQRVLGDAALAEDACQETWLQVRDLAGRFQPQGDAEAAARGWILAIAVNVALHMQRKRGREFAREERHARDRDRERRSEAASEVRTMDRERMAAVHSALAELGEHDRTPIVLHYLGGLEYRQVAEVLGCPVGTAKARVSRGMEKLRNRLVLLGMIFATGELSAFLIGADAHAAEAAPSPEQFRQWKELLGSTRKPAMPPMAPTRGVSLMTKISCAMLAALVLIAVLLGQSRSNGAEGSRDKQQKGTAAVVDGTRKDRLPANPAADGLRPDTEPKAPAADPAKPATKEEQQQAVADLNKAAFKLYEQLAQSEKGNLFFSPYSIVTALSMAHAGARGETAAEMEKALAYSLAERQPAGIGALAQFLNGTGKDRGYQLSVANRLFGQQGYPFERAFIQDGQTHFGAGLEALDFSQCEAARTHINTWVEDRTHQKIKDLLPPDSIKPLTRLVLVNAIYFKAQWMLPFHKAHTREAAFRLADGKAVQAPFMNQTAYFNYAELEDGKLQALEIAYRGRELSMLVLLPAQAGGIGALDRLLSDEKAGAWLKLFQPHNVSLSLPRFTSEWGGTMNETLKSLGMRKAFQMGAANFTGMAKVADDPLSIALVIHKAFVSVDEIGTEAAAATAVGMLGSDMPKEPKVFRADRPFVYLIRERSTGAILFLGRVMNPVQ